MCLLLCLSLEWLKDGLCSQIVLAVCLLVVFRSSGFPFSAKEKGRRLHLEGVWGLIFSFS